MRKMIPLPVLLEVTICEDGTIIPHESELVVGGKFHSLNSFCINFHDKATFLEWLQTDLQEDLQREITNGN